MKANGQFHAPVTFNSDEGAYSTSGRISYFLGYLTMFIQPVNDEL
jgi:hypothetical protein